MKVAWLPRAVCDLKDLREYIARENPSAANKVASKIRETVQLLPEHPYMGHPTELEDVYEKQVIGLPFLIPYRVVGQQLQVLRIFHEAQMNPEEW